MYWHPVPEGKAGTKLVGFHVALLKGCVTSSSRVQGLMSPRCPLFACLCVDFERTLLNHFAVFLVLWFFFTNSLHQLLSLPRASVLHIMRHFSKLLEVLETLWHGRKMKATRPEMSALCREDWKSLVPALTNSTLCKGWADCPRTLYQLQENKLLPGKRNTLKCHPFGHASLLTIHPLVLLAIFFKITLGTEILLLNCSFSTDMNSDSVLHTALWATNCNCDFNLENSL